MAKSSSYDCVGAKREAQARIHEDIKGRSREEQAAYYRQQSASGDLGVWWQRVHARRLDASDEPVDAA
jgi:hypothetical protein